MRKKNKGDGSIYSAKLASLINRTVPIAFAFLLLSFNFYCFAEDKIVAIVNDDCITQKDLGDFINFMKLRMPQRVGEKQAEEKIETMKKDLLERLIEDRLILQEAKKSNLLLDQNRIKIRIDEIKQQYPNDADFQGELKKQGLVQADIETKISDQMLMYDIIDQKIRRKIIIRPDEVTNFYNNNKNDFISTEERELEVITFENNDFAEKFYRDLEGGQRFEDLVARDEVRADKLSVTHRGELKKEIEEVIFKLNLSQVSQPLALDNKTYIFRLENIVPPKQLSLPEVQDKIQRYLFEKKMREELTKWLDELKKQSYIKIMQS